VSALYFTKDTTIDQIADEIDASEEELRFNKSRSRLLQVETTLAALLATASISTAVFLGFDAIRSNAMTRRLESLMSLKLAIMLV
jgi:hypothetical protein